MAKRDASMSPKTEKTSGFTVRLFLPSGDPEWVKVIEKSNWTGHGLVIPRSLYGEERDRKPLHQGAGVYVLVGNDEDSSFPRVYIGEGDPVGPRLDQHAKIKDFWTHAVIFTSKDQNLNKAHVQYLEYRLVTLAQAAKRSILDNGNIPQSPSLSEVDISESEGFLANVLLCFPVLGYGLFEVIEALHHGTTELFLESKNVKARGYESSGGFIVRKGSQAVRKEVRSIYPYLQDLRKSLLERGVLVEKGEIFELVQDYAFGSPSTAAGMLLGRSANGRVEWKDKDGRTLKSLQEGEVSHAPKP